MKGFDGALLLTIALPALASAQAPEPIPPPLPPGRPLPAFVYRPVTAGERAQWFAVSTVGPRTLGVGVLSAGWGTARNFPPEYGGTWEGFGKRYGMRLTGIAASNSIEAGLGAVWGEDPRYFASGKRGMMARVGHAGKLTFLAYRPDGKLAPAYARFAGNPGGSFLSNTWRVDSEANARQAMNRVYLGFAGRFASNLFSEFWPDIRNRRRSKK